MSTDDGPRIKTVTISFTWILLVVFIKERHLVDSNKAITYGMMYLQWIKKKNRICNNTVFSRKGKRRRTSLHGCEVFFFGSNSKNRTDTTSVLRALGRWKC